MPYNIIQDFLTNNRPGIKLTPIGTVVHATAVPGATAKNIRDSFQNHPGRPASAHATIDWNEIRQMIPWNEEAWHACKTGNKLYLGCELCQPMQHDPTKFQAVWDRAIWLFAYWLKDILGITKVTTDNLLSHAEVSARYHESNHTDPVAYFAEYGRTVDDFRAAVQAEINSMLGGDNMKTIVTYVGDADVFAAVIVAQKLHCPMMAKADYDASGIKAEKVIQIGGKAGSDRFSSFKDAANLV